MTRDYDRCILTVGDEPPTCPCCGGETILLTTHRRVFQCLECKHCCKEYDRSLSNYYNDEYRKKHPLFHSERRQTFAGNIVDFFSPILRDLQSKGEFTLLEVGSGDSYLSKLIKQRFGNARLNIVELDASLAKRAEADPEIEKSLSMSFYDIPDDEQYDVVIMMDVLEHLPYLDDAMVKLVNVTRQYWMVQVPISRVINSAGDEHWGGHLHDFTNESLVIYANNGHDGKRFEQVQYTVETGKFCKSTGRLSAFKLQKG